MNISKSNVQAGFVLELTDIEALELIEKLTVAMRFRIKQERMTAPPFTMAAIHTEGNKNFPSQICFCVEE